MSIAPSRGWYLQELQNILRVYLDTYVFRKPLQLRSVRRKVEQGVVENNALIKAIDKYLDEIQGMIEGGNIKQALSALIAIRVVTKGTK